jgi:drug/metabolite transporter (DMT)-like permease
LQSAISLLTFIGLQRIGTSRSQPLRNRYPLWSTAIAIAVMHEQASAAVLAGTLLVVAEIVLISWKPETTALSYRWCGMCFTLWARVSSPALPFR